MSCTIPKYKQAQAFVGSLVYSLKDTAAPSTINLLDDEETENKDLTDEHFQFTDEQYKVKN